MNTPFRKGEPRRKGWYIVQMQDDHSDIRIRAWGSGMWWTDMGRGNGKDGWVGSPGGRPYLWLGPCGDVMKDKPSYPQAVRNLPSKQRDSLMEWAAEQAKTLYVEQEIGMEKA